MNDEQKRVSSHNAVDRSRRYQIAAELTSAQFFPNVLPSLGAELRWWACSCRVAHSMALRSIAILTDLMSLQLMLNELTQLPGGAVQRTCFANASEPRIQRFTQQRRLTSCERVFLQRRRVQWKGEDLWLISQVPRLCVSAHEPCVCGLVPHSP